jgi:hypothetical protein
VGGFENRSKVEIGIASGCAVVEDGLWLKEERLK